ncbi:MAG TPA: hypothetical protein VM101_04265 [Flavitalea sp.]|nr:hypothetical protein [Flavitalea sp.]
MKRLLITVSFCYTCIFGACQQNDAPKARNNQNDISYHELKKVEIPHFAIDALKNVNSDDAEKLEALNIKDFSRAMPAGERVQPNAKVEANEDTARGTNVAPAIMAAIKAANKGQFVIIGPGEWVVSTPIDLPSSKQVNLVCMGNLHFNKRDGFRITAPVGTDPQHHLFFYGSLIGAENLPRHTRATHDAGTQPAWSQMKNTAIDITNCNKNFVLVNRAENFGNAVRINGGKGLGAESNTISFEFFYKNANGITLRSIDGNSYVDHNKFIGFYGGAGRISGGLAINIDGYEGAAPNGEPYNGAFRSNEFHFLIAQVDSIIRANGDVTEPLFDITIEGGDNTGVYGNAFQIRTVAPNYVRTPKYCGAGIFNTKWLTGGLGINGVIMGVPVYYNNHTLLGTNGKTDGKGNIIIETSGTVSKKIKDDLPPNIILQ